MTLVISDFISCTTMKLTFASELNVSATFELIAMKFGIDIHFPLRLIHITAYCVSR